MSDEAPKIKGLLWAVAAVTAGIFLAVGLTPVVHAIPWKWEEALSSLMRLPSGKTCPGNRGTKEHLKQLVGRLYPLEPDDGKISVDVEIADDEAVNAYAGLGGHIFINRGLLEKAASAEEVAGVLAHEIEHVKRRHILENAATRIATASGVQMIFTGTSSPNTQWLNYFLTMNFTRAQESEADEGGLRRLQLAHIDNSGFKDFFKRMERGETAQTFLSDHPENEKRYQMADTFKNMDPKPIMTHEEWLNFKGYCN